MRSIKNTHPRLKRTRLTRYLPALACMLFPLLCFSQKQGNIWYFGDHAGLDFNSGSPVTLNDGQVSFFGCPGCHSEGSSVISDSSGHLLFYSNGGQIWNKNHFVMPNGDSLMSNGSATQGSIIVPKPGSSRFFYVFTTDDFAYDGLQYGCRYSVVDICLDGGLGDIEEGQKNILLLDTVAEKLTAVKHGNGVDYWIIIHKFYSDAFYAYHLSSAGIVDTVISPIGSIQPPIGMGIGASIGQLKASPNGQRLAIVNGNSTPAIAEYFDFNTNTGVVSNPVSVQTNSAWNYYGVSFSPDNTKLYLACSLNGNGIYQFDLTAGGGDTAAVIASRTLIAGSYNYLGLQLATNGKIYVARSPFASNTYLGVINNPNNAGISCNYVDSAINLNGHSASYGLPNFIDSYDYSNTTVNCPINPTTGMDESYSGHISVYPNPANQEITIEFENSLNASCDIMLYDSYGRLVQTINQSTGNKVAIKRGDLPGGFYFYKIHLDGKLISTGKLILE
jgi:hypothetical protein